MTDRSEEQSFHPRSKRSQYLHIRVSSEDRARLVRLSHKRGQSGAEVMRSLIREAAEREAT